MSEEVIRPKMIEKWKKILLEAENVASEVLQTEEANELTQEELYLLLDWSGDIEWLSALEFIVEQKKMEGSNA